jgi:hypothetical protein
MYKSLMAAAASAFLLATPSFAGGGTATGAAGGAVTGAVVGGPVGAAVGAVGGAIVGTALDPPPPEVVTYVREQPLDPVTIDGQVVVGKPLPQTVVVQPIPDHETYAYAYVNGAPVIVESNTHKVVTVVQ